MSTEIEYSVIILITVLLAVSMFTGCKNEPKVYTVTFDVNGGTGTIAEQAVKENEKATKPTTVPTHTGWGLIGWSTTKDGTTAFDFDKNAITADITLYAMWQTSYTVGGKGPAGGYIFYDVDADNNETKNDGLTSAELGWRYLEVAPEDISGTYIFGYYRTSDGGTNETVGTKQGIGEGKANTEALVKAMGEKAYSGTTGPEKTSYAAKACADYTCDGYDDWFLPSEEALGWIYSSVSSQGKGGTWQSGYYCSSSEQDNINAIYWRMTTYNRQTTSRNVDCSVRAVRAF